MKPTPFVFLLAALPVAALPAPAFAQETGIVDGTFSIIGRDPQTGDLGIAVASRTIAVGARVRGGKAGVAVFAHQSGSNPMYSELGVELLLAGFTPDSALALLQGLRREGRVTGDVELEIARALDGVGEYARAADAWRAGARTEGTRAGVYYAFAARSAARAGDGALARDALSDAARSAPADDRAAGTLAALERLIESGCYQAGTCEGDPLSRPTGNSAEGNP